MDIGCRDGSPTSVIMGIDIMINQDNSHFHTSCFACGKENDYGLHLVFKDNPQGCSCNISIPSQFKSYDNVIHGGIIATMLDSAMLHSLRVHDDDAPITCRLEVKYLQAIPPETTLTIIAKRKGKRDKILLSDAQLLCNNVCYARAQGAFIISKQNEV